MTWEGVLSGGASLFSDQQHLASGAAANICHCATYVNSRWGAGGKKIGTNFLASHFLKVITFYNRDCLVLDTVTFLLSLYTVQV